MIPKLALWKASLLISKRTTRSQVGTLKHLSWRIVMLFFRNINQNSVRSPGVSALEKGCRSGNLICECIKIPPLVREVTAHVCAFVETCVVVKIETVFLFPLGTGRKRDSTGVGDTSRILTVIEQALVADL